MILYQCFLQLLSGNHSVLTVLVNNNLIENCVGEMTKKESRHIKCRLKNSQYIKSETNALAFLNAVDHIVSNIVLGLNINLKSLDGSFVAFSLVSFLDSINN